MAQIKSDLSGWLINHGLVKLALFSFLGLSVLLCTTSCNTRPDNVRFRFDPLGIRVTGNLLDYPISLYDSGSHLILSYPPMGDNVLLIFHWRPNAKYHISIGGFRFSVKAPSRRPVAIMRVAAPLGQRPVRYFLPSGLKSGNFTFMGEAGQYQIGILFENLKPDQFTFSVNGNPHQLTGEFSRFFASYYLNFKRGDTEKTLNINLPALHQDIKLHFTLKHGDLSHDIRLVSWTIPTDAYGRTEGTRLKDAIILPSPLWKRLGYIFGLKEAGFSKYDPTAFQCLEFKNLLSSPLSLLIKADFIDEKTHKPVPGLYPKQFGPTGGTKKIITFVDIPARSEARAVLPIYIDKSVSPGEYLVKISVQPFGYPRAIKIYRKKMGILRGSSFMTTALLFIIAISILYWIFAAFNIKKWFTSFNLRSLVLIALMGAVGFGLDFLGGMASNILHAVLGPFNILVGGLITETCHYLVLTAILCLIPRIGTVSLSGLVSYVMSGTIFGGFGILDVLFVGSRLAYQEGLLYLFGITRNRSIRGHGFLLMLALSIADALMTGTILILYGTFYRLFYPMWYIILAVVVKGFFYTMIGSGIGLSFGRKLMRMER